jgi:quercetin dioxygenase-like cupin family protein
LDEDDVKGPNESGDPNMDNKIYQKYQIDEMTYIIILNGDMSDKKYSLIEIEFPTGKEKEIPLHKHTKENIIIYVIEGNFRFKKETRILTEPRVLS